MQVAIVAADQRVGDAVGAGGVGERPTTLVAVPLLVDRRVVGGHPAKDGATAVVGAGCTAACAVLAHARGRDEVIGAGTEAVCRAGQRADGADLDGVAGEVGLERLVLVDADLLQGATLDQGDERVARDLVGKTRAAGAEDTALAVEQYLRGDVDRFGVGALDVLEAARGPPVGHGLVLQGALAALVADRAVQRVVDQQELHLAVLGLVGHRRGVLRLDRHALAGRGGARGHRLGHGPQRPVGARGRDLDHALAAGAHRVQQRVVTEPRDLHADLLGGADQQGALGDADGNPVDGQVDQVRGGGRGRR